MKFTFTTITALIAPILGQSITPAPTSTDPWYGSGPPWASSDPGKWSSIYESLLSAGKIPSTLTAAPWPTGSYGPGQGPWGPGGPHGPGGPGRHWGGKIASVLIPNPHTPSPPQSKSHTNTTPRPRRPRPLRRLQLRPLQRLVHTLRLAIRPLDRMVGRQCVSAIRLAWLDSRALE